jgi:hypothetical protein
MLYLIYLGLWHALLALLDIPAAGALCRQRAANLASLYASSPTRSCYGMLYLLYLIYLPQELSVDSVRRIWRLCMHLQLLALAMSLPLRQVLLA